jgi:two-component system chemotaxis sensor kinase CheA
VDKEKLAERLLGIFLEELEEHVHALNRDLLALERGPLDAERAELFKTLFRTAHSLKGAARSANIREIEAACHRLEDLFAAARDGRVEIDPDVFQVLYDAADAIAEAGKALREKSANPAAPLAPVLPRLQGVMAEKRPPAEHAATRAPAPEASAPPAPASPARPAPAPVPASPRAGKPVVRVVADRLDALLECSGELLVARRRFDARAGDVADLQDYVRQWQAEWAHGSKAWKAAGTGARTDTLAEGPSAAPAPALDDWLQKNRDRLTRLARELDRLAAELARDRRALEQAGRPLEEQIRQLRMLPLGEACRGMERLVRDLARSHGKQVELAIEGAEILLDRSILQGLKDPLVQLVRNAVDHGIETPEERRAAGKNASGRVVVSAAVRGNGVEIVVADDGRGLDLEAIRRKARQQGLPVPEDDTPAAQLVFHPGFTTSPVVTEVSGRGVGLDVVKTALDALHGATRLSFEPGRGARFTLTVPLTLATMRALIVSAGGETFALAASSVDRLMRVGLDDVHTLQGREAIRVDGEAIVLASLARTLGLRERESAASNKRLVAVVRSSGQRVAFAIDEARAEQEIAAKPLGPRFKRVRNVSGATLQADGTVALVLNASELVRSALRSPRQRVLPAPTAQRRKRLLVVDDSVTTRTLEKSILENAGYEVIAAADGVEALRLLEDRGADLVVADVEMPRMDGFTLTENLRRSERFRDLPVVLVTALESAEHKTRGMEAGADAYLVKSSFDQANLLETVAQLL